MKRAFLVLFGIWVVASLGESVPSAQAPGGAASSSPAQATQYRALLDQYCVTCHNDRLKTAGLSLEGLDTSNLPANKETWE